MVKVANNYEPTIYNHIFLMAVIRNSANSVSNDRFGLNEYLQKQVERKRQVQSVKETRSQSPKKKNGFRL